MLLPSEVSALPLPDLVIAADWGVRWEKRWMARAVREPDGRGYTLSHPVPVGASEAFVRRVREHLPEGGTALLGFDFPIGLPRGYSERVFPGMSFREILVRLGEEFFKPTDEPCLERPFGPQSAGPGVFGPARLAEILGVELLRDCDRKSKANPMFFTLGARQVGRAAADGWKHVIRPALEEARSEGVEIDLTPSAEEWVEAGFASSDDFDPMLSVVGMLRALRSKPSLEPPGEPAARRAEGWILGLGSRA